MPLLEPDRYFSRLSHVDIERDLLALGFRFVLLDIDNTILTRDTHEVPRDAGFWLAKARDAGITFCLVSNNWHEGVYQLANRLSLPIVAKAVKPLPPAFLRALGKIGATRAATVVIGDQLVTDVLGAHFLGMKAYLLAPLVEQDLPPRCCCATSSAWSWASGSPRVLAFRRLASRRNQPTLPLPQHPISRRCRRLACRSIPQGDFLRGAFRLRHPHDLGRRGNPR